jgi:hypothetical protein
VQILLTGLTTDGAFISQAGDGSSELLDLLLVAYFLFASTFLCFVGPLLLLLSKTALLVQLCLHLLDLFNETVVDF